MKKLLNETIIYGIGAILPRVIYFVLNPFFIHQIGREEFAQFTNLYAYISYINIILTLGFETTFFRYSAEKGNEQKAFNTSFWFLCFTSGVFLGTVLLFNQSIAEAMGYGKHPEYIRWFACIAFIETIAVIPLAWLRFNNMPMKYSAVRVLQVLFQVTCVLALFLIVPAETSANWGMTTKVSYAFVSNVLAVVFGLMLLLPIILKVKWQFSISLFRRMIVYSFPIMLAGLAFMVNENFDKLINIYYIPKSEAGAYGGCYKLAALMTLFVTAYRMGVEPFFFKQIGNKNAPLTYAKVTEYFTIFASIVAMGIIANITWLKQLFIPNSSYWIAMDIVPVIIIANLCFGIYYNLSTWYKITDRTFMGTYISGFGAIVTIVFNLIFLERYGLMTSAWVTLLAYFIMMVASYLLGQKYYPIPYPVTKILLILGGLSVCSILSYWVFNGNIWIGNLLFLTFTLILVWTERNLFFALMKRKNLS